VKDVGQLKNISWSGRPAEVSAIDISRVFEKWTKTTEWRWS